MFATTIAYGATIIKVGTAHVLAEKFFFSFSLFIAETKSESKRHEPCAKNVFANENGE